MAWGISPVFPGTSDFLRNWRKIQLKLWIWNIRRIFLVSRTRVLKSLNRFSLGRGSTEVWMTLPSRKNENWWKRGRGEDRCENRLSFRHENISRRVKCRQILTTSLNVKEMCAKMILKRVWLNTHQFLTEKQIRVLKHTPNLPDATLRYFFLS